MTPPSSVAAVTAPRNIGRLLLLVMLATSGLDTGCRKNKIVEDRNVTGVRITVRYDTGLRLSGLMISGTVGDDPAFTPGLLPETPRTLNAVQEVAVLLLPETLVGKTVVIRVDGRSGATVLASGQQAVIVRARSLVDVTVTLGERAVCGDLAVRIGIETCDDGNTASGDGCSSICRLETAGSCNPASCPDGCCLAGSCHPRATETCGVGGAACVNCDMQGGDACSANGACTCGAGPACASGQRCQGGSCVCDRSSCPDGCCAAGSCLKGDSTEACGAGGLACQSCSTGRCAGGVCDSCGPSTCPSGCCSGATCYPRSVSTCGIGGLACTGCDPDKVDTCSVNGACRCGGKAPCADGQRCMNGVCLCDADSCPSGCCAGDVCSAPSLTTCGIKGATCLPCDSTRADRCGPLMGACRCGVGPPCTGGQRCAGGQCICDASSCPSGCCDGAVCAVRSLLACGDAGSTCARCDSRADNCSATGVCRCGSGTTCALGQRCMGSTCVCDGTSCPDGCCAAGVCLAGDTASSCGAGGNGCEVCPADQACNQGRCSGCNATTCPDGCCSGATCSAPSTATCGRAASTCVGCDVDRADNCSAAGTCACGAGPVCGPGQRCRGGNCGCDPAACPSGCCDGTSCVAPSLARCGSAGSACVACNPALSDSCTDAGSCGCGAGAACAAGQRCTMGSCVCDATSCPGGCCAGTTCRSPTLASCGSAGGACAACGITADTCAPSGACQCGAGAACATGQHCVAGVCVCDGTSCANGCCSGTTCLPGTSGTSCGSGGGSCQDCQGEVCSGGACGNCTAVTCGSGCCSGFTCTNTGSAMACGAGGAACVPCDPSRADNCSLAGECRCGSTAACGGGTSCVAGVCTCSPLSCPGGCCAGSSCIVPTLASCGMGGQACAACNSTLADHCDTLTGRCACGTGAACATGTACVSGACLCNSISCPSGCCSAGVCLPPSSAACGARGGTCVACDPVTADACSTLGECQCGATRACPAGRRCQSGQCVCDATSCPDGCCATTGACLPGNKDSSCGTGGITCQQCAAGSTCKKRRCQ